MQDFYGLVVEDLSDFIGEPIEEEDVKRAEWCLRQAAGLVEAELAGKEFDPGLEPAGVQNVLISCASRGYVNPGSYQSESSDDWSGSNAPIREMGFYLTATERSTLAQYTSRSTGIGSVSFARGDLSANGLTGYVRDEDGILFPWYGR